MPLNVVVQIKVKPKPLHHAHLVCILPFIYQLFSQVAQLVFMVTNVVKHVIVMEHHVMLLLEHVTAQPEKCCPSVLKVRTSIIFSFLTNLNN